MKNKYNNEDLSIIAKTSYAAILKKGTNESRILHNRKVRNTKRLRQLGILPCHNGHLILGV